MSRYTLLLAITIVLVVADQLTKALVLAHLPLYSVQPLIPGFLNLVHVQNPGGAFGFMAGQSYGLRMFLFLFVTALALVMIVVLYRQTPPTNLRLRLALALLCGGAIGNLIDRLRLGQVVDFIDVHVAGWHWPAFNVADSAITVGVLLFALDLLWPRPK